jgi:uncharacterized protein YpuA (DUF1002 family)
MPKVTIEIELTEQRINRVIEMFEEMDETLAEMRKISQELKEITQSKGERNETTEEHE